MDSRNFFCDFGKALYHIDSFYNEYAKQNNVTLTMLRVLYALNDKKLHTQIEISTDSQLPKTTVNTVIKDLEQNGYVELVPIKGKRREMSIVLTESGREYAKVILSDIYKMEEAVFLKLSDDERNVTNVLERIAECLKGEMS